VNKTVSSVIDDINEWNGPNGTIYYVTAIFTDESVGSAGKKNYDAALEVQGLLREAIGVEQDFTLESKGQTKTGREKFAIKGFGTPGGAATYTAPGVQGTGGQQKPTGDERIRSPEQNGDDPRRSKEEMRRSEALRAAASFLSMTAVSTEKVLEVAEFFEEWLEHKTSDASSAYEVGSGTASPVDATNDQAGASEDRGGGVESEGKEPAPPSHDDDPVTSMSTDKGQMIYDGEIGTWIPADSHIHDWQPHPNLRNKLKCECGEMRNKERV
jgi:hypothetical protein